MLDTVAQDEVDSLIKRLESAFEGASIIGHQHDGLVHETIDLLGHFCFAFNKSKLNCNLFKKCNHCQKRQSKNFLKFQITLLSLAAAQLATFGA